MNKKLVFILMVLLALVLLVPAYAWADDIVGQELGGDVVGPVALVTFGFLALVCGLVVHMWRQRKESKPSPF